MLNELAKQINKGVRKKGFWDSMDSSLKGINSQFAYCDTDDMENAINAQYKATKDAFIAQKIALIQSELSEALEAMRKGDYTENGYGVGKKDSFADELIDAVVRIFDLGGELGIDLDAQLAFKLAYNAQRESKHGKQF